MVVGESGRWVLLLTPSDTSSCSVIYVCHIVCCMTHAGRCRHTRPAGRTRQDGEEAVRDKAGLEQTELKAAQIFVVPHRVFVEKRQDGNDKCPEMGKIQPLLSAECNSYEGFVEKQVFPPWKSRAASSWRAFFFLFFVFRIHIWNSQCIVSEGETKLNIVADTSMDVTKPTRASRRKRFVGEISSSVWQR